jgi:hypothetical protein
MKNAKNELKSPIRGEIAAIMTPQILSETYANGTFQPIFRMIILSL